MEKVWLKNYKAGINAEIKASEASLIDLFEHACKRYAYNTAITCHNEHLSFSELRLQVLKVAQGLLDLGLKKGDRVAVILPNSLQYPIVVFAIFAVGGIVVNINPLYTEHEIEYIIQDSTPKFCFCLDLFSEKLNNIQAKHKLSQVIITKISDPYPFFKRTLINLVLRFISHVKPKLSYKPIKFFDLYYHAQHLNSFITLHADDIAFIQYTGATTGKPKGAILTHRNIVANIHQVHSVLEAQIPDLEQQIVICALPLYHIFSLTANLFTFLFHGAQNVMIPNARNIKDLVQTMNKTKFSIFNGLDTLYHKLLAYKPFLAKKHPNFKYGICGGMSTRASVAERWKEVTGLELTNCYGLTETSPAVSLNYCGEPFDGSVGYPIPSTEVDIRDLKEFKLSLNVDEGGVIFVRGPQVMRAYWNNVEASSYALSADGWLNTGDIGYINSSGKLFITSRLTEMIIVSGFNVYPAEIEEVIDKISDVEEVAVIGVPDSATGESVLAYVVLKPDAQLTSHDILVHCKKYITKYKLPDSIFLVDKLPKTLVGKIDKKHLIQEFLNK